MDPIIPAIRPDPFDDAAFLFELRLDVESFGRGMG